MSFWDKLKDAFRAPPPPRPMPAPPPMPPEEAYLRQLLGRLDPEVSGGSAATANGQAGHAGHIGSIGGREFWSAIDRLIAAGRERTAIELLRRFVALRDGEPELAARLVELLCDHLEHESAVPVLAKLTRVPEHALRAHFLLGEAHERAGRQGEARHHYEAAVALDVDYPNARARADRLRHHDPALAAALAATGAVAGALDPAPTLLGVAGADAQLASRYRLQRELGRGSAGAVYLARDEELACDVALKILHPRAASLGASRARSFNEARIAAALRHPGVVAVLDIDEARNLIAMELCRGGTLRDRLQRGRLAPSEALRRAVELCATLAAVHRAGVVHLDLKPGNILFRESSDGDGDLVLADFGLAHLAGDGDGASSEAAGTLAYMAPERRRGEVSTAVDLFAVGGILLEMLAGAGPADRGAVLRGDAWAGATQALPEVVALQLGAAAPSVMALVRELLAEDPAARPSAPVARDRLRALAGAVR